MFGVSKKTQLDERVAGEPEPVLNVDEIQEFQDARVIGSSEGSYRLFNIDIYHRNPAVMPLAVHLENMQYTIFSATEQDKVATRGAKGSSLTAWFSYISTNNQLDRHQNER